jgi:hypothetical protein
LTTQQYVIHMRLFHYNIVVEQPRGFTHSVLWLGVQLDSSMPIIDIL